jgi:tetratricopeptide (TPR) repeat protein
LEIYKKSRPSQHPSIASTLRNIGLVYKDMKDYRQALSYFEKAAAIYRHSFASTHPDNIQIEKDIRYVASKLT